MINQSLTNKLLPNARRGFFICAAALLVILAFDSQNVQLIASPVEYGHYFLIGICAAIIANATGAGGGIVFLPAFIALGLSAQQSLATSFAIQCFGMTSGALAWLVFRSQEQLELSEQWQSFWRIVIVAAVSSIAGLLLTQRLMPIPPLDVELLFSVFSLLVGAAILWRTLRLSRLDIGRAKPITQLELISLCLACLAGGIITAWLSVGVGEILAVLLIFWRFRVNLAIAAAVVVSSLNVLAAIIYYLTPAYDLVQSTGDAINLSVLIYAAPGALIGGAIARRLATRLGAKRLKITMAIWIIVTAIIYLARSSS